MTTFEDQMNKANEVETPEAGVNEQRDGNVDQPFSTLKIAHLIQRDCQKLMKK